MNNLQNIIAENNQGTRERCVYIVDNPGLGIYLPDEMSKESNHSQLRLIEGFREMVREKQKQAEVEEKQSDNDKIKAYFNGAYCNLGALLSELGSINEIK